MRRMKIKQSLDLGQGYSSGGFMANSDIEGTVHANSQQQFFFRNNNMNGGFTKGAWNFVFVGNSGNVPGSHCGTSSG